MQFELSDKHRQIIVRALMHYMAYVRIADWRASEKAITLAEIERTYDVVTGFTNARHEAGV
jgi:hypothetical protein